MGDPDNKSDQSYLAPDSLELQYSPGVSVWVDPANEVEVPHVEGAVWATGERHGGKQHHVSGCSAAAGTTGDTAVETVPHDGADDRGLLGEEDIFPVSFVEDSCGGGKALRLNTGGLLCYKCH